MLSAGAGRFGLTPGGDRPRGDSTCWTSPAANRRRSRRLGSAAVRFRTSRGQTIISCPGLLDRPLALRQAQGAMRCAFPGTRPPEPRWTGRFPARAGTRPPNPPWTGRFPARAGTRPRSGARHVRFAPAGRKRPSDPPRRVRFAPAGRRRTSRAPVSLSKDRPARPRTDQTPAPSLSNREGPASVSGDSWSEGTWNDWVQWTLTPRPASSEAGAPICHPSGCQITIKLLEIDHDSGSHARTTGLRPWAALRSPGI
jgi:hypothetical protein